MKSGKIVSLDDYRTGRTGGANGTPTVAGGLPLPSANRLWELLDRNISIAVWRELH